MSVVIDPLDDIASLNATVARVVGGFKNAVLADVGAANGGTARQLCGWLTAPFSRFFVIEADPRNNAYMTKVGLPDRVERFECAIGAADGVGTLHLSDSDHAAFGGMWSVSSSMRKPKQHLVVYPDIRFDRVAPVTVRSMDSLCAEHGVVGFDLLWVDIQGAERDLVEGGRATLAKSRYLFIEAEEQEMYEGQWTRQQLLDNMPGWEVVGAWRTDILLRNTAL